MSSIKEIENYISTEIELALRDDLLDPGEA